MAEYLAPGVYVEETSFRAKSLEGVSTSTTGFVGPCRKGPIGDTPELLTAFGDFQRIYGGLDDLALQGGTSPTNYLALAVMSYFNEGGSRLYVSRAFAPNSAQDRGVARSPNLIDASNGRRAWFVARWPGAAGNGQITLREATMPATATSMAGAPDGTVLRLGAVTDKTPARSPARLFGSLVAPYTIGQSGVLSLKIDGTVVESPVALPAGASRAVLTADDLDATLHQTQAPARAALLAPTGRLVLASEDLGARASLAVLDRPESVHRALGLPAAGAVGSSAPASLTGAGKVEPFAVAENAVLQLAIANQDGGNGGGSIAFAQNAVADLNAVTADEVDALLQKANIGATASKDAAGHLVLTTKSAGDKVTLAVQDPANPAVSAAAAFGLDPAAQPAKGTAAPAKLIGGTQLTAKPGGVLALTVNGQDGAITFTADSVKDFDNITPDEINQLLDKLDPKLAVSASADASGRLVLATNADPGASAMIVVRDAPNSVHAGLGLSAASSGAEGAAVKYYVKQNGNWIDSDGQPLDPAEVPPVGGAAFLSLNVTATDADGNAIVYNDLGYDPAHPQWIGKVLAEQPARRAEALENVFALHVEGTIAGFDLRDAFFEAIGPGESRVVSLTGGNDGAEPVAQTYADALAALETVEEVSIVAAPGHSAYGDFAGIQRALISHVEKPRAYRIAVLDTPPGEVISEAANARAQIDSTHAALYYPWVVVSNPRARPGDSGIPREIALPPSGFMCGIYARSDDARGVYKAPANEVVYSALRFETDVNFAQQEVLNPIGVNCLRYFPGRGYRVWGARTASSDPEWKYVNVRRYFNYLEASIDRGTQWAVFEPNGERLWANVRNTISDFLYNEWASGALLGGKPADAFFVRCDRTTMTQNDLDNGRLICLVGVAPLKPAEFVIFRIGQMTADSRS